MSSQEMRYRIKREALIEQIKEIIPKVKAEDEAALKAHYADIKVVARKRRDFLRSLAKQTDRQLAEMGGSWDRRGQWPGGASCPVAKVRRFENAVAFLERDTRTHITVVNGGEWDGLLRWTPTPAKGTVC